MSSFIMWGHYIFFIWSKENGITSHSIFLGLTDITLITDWPTDGSNNEHGRNTVTGSSIIRLMGSSVHVKMERTILRKYFYWSKASHPATGRRLADVCRRRPAVGPSLGRIRTHPGRSCQQWPPCWSRTPPRTAPLADYTARTRWSKSTPCFFSVQNWQTAPCGSHLQKTQLIERRPNTWDVGPTLHPHTFW